MGKTKPETMTRVTTHYTGEQLEYLEKRAKSEQRTLAAMLRVIAQEQVDKSKKGARK